jgi:hypothetical protein
MLPTERVSLDIQWEAQTPDRPDAARVDAILPRPVDRQLDRRLLFGHLALVGQAAVRASDKCETDPCPVVNLRVSPRMAAAAI